MKLMFSFLPRNPEDTRFNSYVVWSMHWRVFQPVLCVVTPKCWSSAIMLVYWGKN